MLTCDLPGLGLRVLRAARCDHERALADDACHQAPFAQLPHCPADRLVGDGPLLS